MTHFNTKQLVMVGRIGPAFSLSEIPAAHEALDRAGAPRALQGRTLTLPERIAYIATQLERARARENRKQIFIIHKEENGNGILGVYPESEVKS
jgi:hypothetical protein